MDFILEVKAFLVFIRSTRRVSGMETPTSAWQNHKKCQIP